MLLGTVGRPLAAPAGTQGLLGARHGERHHRHREEALLLYVASQIVHVGTTTAVACQIVHVDILRILRSMYIPL